MQVVVSFATGIPHVPDRYQAIPSRYLAQNPASYLWGDNFSTGINRINPPWGRLTVWIRWVT